MAEMPGITQAQFKDKWPNLIWKDRSNEGVTNWIEPVELTRDGREIRKASVWVEVQAWQLGIAETSAKWEVSQERIDSVLAEYAGKIPASLAKIIKNINTMSTIDLSNSDEKLTDAMLEALIKVLAGSPVEHLDISNNYITNKGMVSLVKVLPKTKIKTLVSRGISYVSAEGWQTLFKALPVLPLTSLTIQGARGNMGSFNKQDNVNELARMYPWSQLTNLNIGDSGVYSGAVSIASNLQGSLMRSLSLEGNHIADEAGEVLLQNIAKSRLVEINVEDTEMTFAMIAKINKALQENKVRQGK